MLSWSGGSKECSLVDNRLLFVYNTAMFVPKYTITDLLLSNIKRISSIVAELNNRRFPNVVLVEMERSANEVSSYSSTSIEGNPLPLTEVKKILKSRPTNIRDSEKEVLNYNQALSGLNELLDNRKARLSRELILRTHKQVVAGLLPPSETGKFRQKPVVVNDPRSGRMVYLPLEVDEIDILMENLINFIKDHKGSIDPLILAGIFHKQMVIIHPFVDGNGRTTRLITKILLAEMGLNTFNLFSFENYYNKNVTKYFQIVGEFGNYYEIVDRIDFTPWLEYFTGGIIDELLRVMKLLPEVGISPRTHLQPFHNKILEFIQANNFVKDSDYAKLTERARATRALDFQKLIELGLIERRGKGKATYYVLKS